MRKIDKRANMVVGKYLTLVSVMGVPATLHAMGIGPGHHLYNLLRTRIAEQDDVGGNCMEFDEPHPLEGMRCSMGGGGASASEEGTLGFNDLLEFAPDVALGLVLGAVTWLWKHKSNQSEGIGNPVLAAA